MSSTEIDLDLHRQFRLYRKDAVSYIGTGHTPGFRLDNIDFRFAPEEAAMIHLDWAIHSYAERKAKIERYDRHSPNHGSLYRSFYLFEEQEGYADGFHPLPIREVGELGHQLATRFPKLTLPGASERENLP